MKLDLIIILAIFGVICGLYYWYLGLMVGDFIKEEYKKASASERFLGASLAWSLDSGEQYSEEGKKICERGNMVLVMGILSWFAWGVVK